MVYKVITVQRTFSVATAVTIQKTICGMKWDIYMVVFSHLEGISNIALLLFLIVHELRKIVQRTEK